MVARTPSRRRILRELHIGKIAAVDRPCQEHARMTIMKRADEEIVKATKTEGGQQFPASDYAYVPDSESPSTWKLRLTAAPGGSPDPGIVGAAAAALGAGFRGNKVEIPQADRAGVVARVRAAWKKANPDKDPKVMPDSIQKDYGMTSPAVISQEVQAVDFDTVLAEQEASEAAQEVGDDLREKWCALQRAFATIAADETVSAADKITAMQDSLQQYIDSLSEQSAEIADSMTKSLTAVPAIAELLKQTGNDEGDDPMTEAEKKQLDGLQKSVEGLTKQLEAATAKEPAKKAADLQKELDDAKAEVEKLSKKISSANELLGKAKEEYDEAVAKAAMSDAEKAHMATLDGGDKMKFMQATPADRAKMMAKSADADPVIYKAADGAEFRKSDGDKMITLAKRADELAKQAASEIKKREDSELAKRADDDLKFFGDTVAKRDDKIEALRAIDKMEPGPKAALTKMLEVGGKAIAAAFTTIGHKNEQLTKSAADFTKKVAEIQKRDNLSASDAMVKARKENPVEFEAYQESGAKAN